MVEPLKFERPLYGPDDSRGPSRGIDVIGVKRGLWNWSKKHDPEDLFRPPEGGFDQVWNRRTVDCCKRFQRWAKVSPPTGNYGLATHRRLTPFFDAVGRRLYESYEKPKPVVRCFVIEKGIRAIDYGGVEAHMARPLGNWQSDNAIDVGARPGSRILCPKSGYVYKISGYDPDQGPHGTIFGQSITIHCPDGDQFFLTHAKLEPNVDVGERVRAAEAVGWIADWPGSTYDHVHLGRVWGRNPEELWDWPRVEA